MILEGIVTTIDAEGRMHAAAMGPEVDDRDIDRGSGRIARLLLKPFASSTTHGNLSRHPEGVFHLTDDVLTLARLVLGEAAATLAARPADAVRGFVLDSACLAYEFRARQAEMTEPRARFSAEIVRTHAMRPFLGFNRASHAVVEGAILVSRIGILSIDEIRRQMERLGELVEKTAGGPEREAFALLAARVAGEP
jgi:hypothetical protein